MFDDISGMTFEAAMSELESIIAKMEAGEVKLAESVRHYERGAALKRHLEKILAEAKLKIEKIRVGPDGTISTESFE